ncbi:retrovirus-related pol polyprotein from transposon TNT 1-94 [Tanacetum coccineum]
MPTEMEMEPLTGINLQGVSYGSLERFYTSAGNPVKEILLKLNLPDHRILKDGGEEFECDSQEPLSPLPKLIGAAPSGTSESLISLSYLTLNMADLTLDTPKTKKTRPSAKADSSTKQLLLTLMEEVKGLKRQIEIPLSTPLSSTQPSSSKASKQKTWFGPCKHCGFRNHLSDDCYSKPKCSTCGFTDHLTKEHLEHVAVKKTLSKLKAQSPLKPSLKKTLMIPKPFIECKYYGFNDHHSDHYEFYPGCEVYDSIAHEASDCPKKHPTLGDQGLPTDSGCSRHMTGIKQYLHRYSKESGLKVVFGDDSSGDTEGYGSVNCNGITFTRVAYMNGMKHNLISISQLCDTNYKVLLPKLREPFTIKMMKLSSLLPKEEMSMSLICHLLIKKMENLNEVRVKELRSNNRVEFRNHKLEEFCNEKGISQNFFSPCTPKQNGVAERRNRTLIEAAKTMLNSAKLSKQFWERLSTLPAIHKIDPSL